MEIVTVLVVILVSLIILLIVQAVQYNSAMKNFLNQTEQSLLNQKACEDYKDRFKNLILENEEKQERLNVIIDNISSSTAKKKKSKKIS
jgi:hypothetical protein